MTLMKTPSSKMRDPRVQKHFGSVIALAGVSVDIYFAGECHCLLGDNGAGKSTFIKTMSGVHKPTAGEILLRRPADELCQTRATRWMPASPRCTSILP